MGTLRISTVTGTVTKNHSLLIDAASMLDHHDWQAYAAANDEFRRDNKTVPSVRIKSMRKQLFKDLTALPTDELWKGLKSKSDGYSIVVCCMIVAFPRETFSPYYNFATWAGLLIIMVFIIGMGNKRLVAEIRRRYEGDGKPIDCPDKRD